MPINHRAVHATPAMIRSIPKIITKHRTKPGNLSLVVKQPVQQKFLFIDKLKVRSAPNRNWASQKAY